MCAIHILVGDIRSQIFILPVLISNLKLKIQIMTDDEHVQPSNSDSDSPSLRIRKKRN